MPETRRPRPTSLSVAAALLAATLLLATLAAERPSAAAAPVQWPVQITPAQVVPPVTSTASGFAVVSFDRDTRQFVYSVTLFGVTAQQAAGIMLRSGASGTNGPIIHVLAGPGQTGASGQTTLSAAQASDLLGGLLYIEAATTDLPGGAARGQLIPPPLLATPTPLPPTPTPTPTPSPTPLPATVVPTTAPATAPATASGVITPPTTGDAGLRR